MQFVTVVVLAICMASGTDGRVISGDRRKRPAEAAYGYNTIFGDQDEIGSEIDSWSPESGTNVWEHSGLYEGDIMVYGRNGLLSSEARWPNSTIPYYIDETFSDHEVNTILSAMQDYHDHTCLRFRPYIEGDANWIDIKPDYSGCWSSVGMKNGGQIVNFGSVKCLRHGVIIHELMHAIGFYHQQSASERDDFIRIHWNNIQRGREHNFNKYDSAIVSDFGVQYDYESVMHYSSRAFTKNGEITIEPIFDAANLGQRYGLSEKDVLKVNKMYAENCHAEPLNITELHYKYYEEHPNDGSYDSNKPSNSGNFGSLFGSFIQVVYGWIEHE